MGGGGLVDSVGEFTNSNVFSCFRFHRVTLHSFVNKIHAFETGDPDRRDIWCPDISVEAKSHVEGVCILTSMATF